jgi:pSer/pThr/pTyr-binding forkhead associated (FHA) protein
MKVKLKVLKGASAGKEIKIPTPKCVVGRGEECHLRPKSDAISRQHCVIYVNKSGQLVVRDLKSKNGTFVNGDRIKEDRVLKVGDNLLFGPLAFEVLIDHSLGGAKKPKVTSIKEAATRTSANGSETVQLDDSEISDWLDEADEIDREQRVADPETRQLKLDETDQVTLQKTLEQRAAQRAAELAAAEAAEQEEAEKQPTGQRGKGPGKLPTRPNTAPANSRDAAADMLKKFFNKR